MSDRVRKFKRGDRGFYSYGKPMKCEYGNTIHVYESSACVPRVWLSIDMDLIQFPKSEPGRAVAHLSPKQAREVVRRLETWLEDNG